MPFISPLRAASHHYHPSASFLPAFHALLLSPSPQVPQNCLRAHLHLPLPYRPHGGLSVVCNRQIRQTVPISSPSSLPHACRCRVPLLSPVHPVDRRCIVHRSLQYTTAIIATTQPKKKKKQTHTAPALLFVYKLHIPNTHTHTHNHTVMHSNQTVFQCVALSGAT